MLTCIAEPTELHLRAQQSLDATRKHVSPIEFPVLVATIRDNLAKEYPWYPLVEARYGALS